MTADASNHPPKDLLIAFGQGKLAETELSRVEDHLGMCPQCCETLLDLKDDTFVGLVRLVKGDAAQREVIAEPVIPLSATAADRDEPVVANAADDAARSATMLVPSGQPLGPDDLPAELAEHPRYRIVELIGCGGMGNVYRAEHRLMNRTVAIKVINSQLVRQSQAVERFRREVQAAAKLSHPNIVAAFDAEQAGDVHFLVMEFVEGTDLASIVKQRGPMSVAEACECVGQAAAGLQHAYEKGMVHRDIKPHNLMRAARGQVRILDFGLAGFAAEAGGWVDERDAATVPDGHAGSGSAVQSAAHLTTMGSVMGTPDYMAPEQAVDAHSADVRADIYSLGCTLHFLLTGKPPFDEGNVIEKLKAHAQEPPPSLTTLRRDVPPELARVVTRMLAKDPAARFQTPAEVVAALAPFAQVARQNISRIGKMVAAALLGITALLAGVIVVVTNRGRLEIHSPFDDVKVSVKQDGQQVELVDLKSGSQVRWLPSGDYELELIGRDTEVQLDKSSLRMTRLGQAIVTATWKPEVLSAVKGFKASDKPIAGDVVADDGGWKITTQAARSVPLFEVPNPNFDVGPFYYRAKLKTENVAGRAYLELWSRLPGGGEYFSKGLDRVISGTNGWAEYEIPFFLQKGQQPDLVKLNVTIEGAGTVWIKDIELRGKVLGARKTNEQTANDASVVITLKEGREYFIDGRPVGTPLEVLHRLQSVLEVAPDKEVVIESPQKYGLKVVRELVGLVRQANGKRLRLPDWVAAADRARLLNQTDSGSTATDLPAGAMSETVIPGFNGGFEVTKSGLPVTWSFYTSRTVPNSDFDIVMDTTDVKQGEQSLKFVVRKCEPTGGRLSPGFFNEFHTSLNPPGPFETKAGETYKISFWAKNAGSGFTFKARGVSAFGGDPGVVIQSKETFNEWRRFYCTYTIPPKMWLRVELNVVQPGTFWIDDVQIAKVNDKAPAKPDSLTEIGRFTGHEGAAGHAIVSPGGKYGISCGSDKTIRVWDLATQEEKRVLKGHEGMVFGLAISTDGKLLASCDNAKSIRLWNLETGEQVTELLGHTGPVTDLAFMPDRTHLLSAGFDETLRFWNVADRKLVKTINVGTYVEKMLPLPDGRRVVLSGAHTRGWGPRIYDLEKGEKIDATPNGDSCMAVTSDGRMLLIGDITGVLRVTDTEKGNQIVQMKDPRANVARDAGARDAAITPDGRFAITTTREHHMYLWDLHGGKLLSSAEGDTIGTITLSPDGRFALTIGQGGISVWRLPENALEPIAAAAAAPNVAALSDEERKTLKAAEEFLALMDQDKFAELYDQSSKLARDRSRRDNIAEVYQGVRKSIGKLEKRSLLQVRLMDQFLGLPPGGRYGAVQFRSSYEKHKGLWETVILNVDHDGQWRANTYAATIQPLPLPEPSQKPQLVAPPAAGPVPTGRNLIVDGSFQQTAEGSLPSGWSDWFNDGPKSRWEIVEGADTPGRMLKIFSRGTRAVVFANSIPLDRSKRYALKGLVKFEGNKDARALIKFNYFHQGKWLGVHDLVGVTGAQEGWHALEKTDAADAYPEATVLVPTCHVEGEGVGWFDDLELVAFDRDKLPVDFDLKHGKNNKQAVVMNFDRWVGEWDTTFDVKQTAQTVERATTGSITTRKVLGDNYLLTHSSGASSPTQFLWFTNYDSQIAAYRLWIFSSDGEAFELRGQWDAASQKLTLDLLPPSPGVTGRSTDRFVGDDQIESTLFVKSGDGKVTRDSRWTARRKSPQPKTFHEIPVAAEPASAPEELKLLNKMVGDWTIRETIKPSVWIPNGEERQSFEKVHWVLGGRYLLGSSFNDSYQVKTIWLATYEPVEKANRFWFFMADGVSGQWRVTWDEASRGFHWRSIDMPPGWIGTGSNRWVNDDTFDNQVLIKDEAGRVMFESSQDKRRTKSN